MTPKIIFTHLLNDYSGSPKILSQVIKAVQKHGYETELYTGKTENGFLSGLVEKHHYYFYKRFDNKYFTLVTFLISQLSLFFKLLRHRNENIVIYVNTLLPFGAGLAGFIMGKPVYYHIHETSLQPAKFKQFLRFIVQKTASKVMFVSKTVEVLESFNNISQEVIYNALPNSFAKVAKKSVYAPIKNDVFNVLMVCSLKAYKGIDEFVGIARRCLVQKELTFTLVLNAEKFEIDAYFEKNMLPKNFFLVSRQNDLVPYYQQASLLVNLSRVDEWIETFGLTIIEAMAFGIPVIAPPVGGPAEIVGDGIEGYLVSSYEINKIVNIILVLFKDKEKCMSLSKVARERGMDFKEDQFEKNIILAIDSMCLG